MIKDDKSKIIGSGSGGERMKALHQKARTNLNLLD